VSGRPLLGFIAIIIILNARAGAADERYCVQPVPIADAAQATNSVIKMVVGARYPLIYRRTDAVCGNGHDQCCF
jgi:hypothetical protein